ncbi:MAG: pentapeptide repeat-containing protein, partial [Crocosphaera sp.]|nr:pentapeptide repeat-containing protein [Crocosphaera sp.]
MKASELINLYNAGTRDFSRECLRGQNFAGKDLSGANLSSCDIRGANFTGANLSSCDIRGANFTGATLIDSDFSQAMAGLTLKSQIVLLFPVMIVVTLSGFLSGWSGSYIAGIFDRSTTEYIISGSLTVASLLIFCVTSYRKGLAAGVFAGICAGAFAEAFTGAFVGAFSGSFAITFAGAFAGAFAGSVTVAIGGIFAGVFTAAFSVGGALVGAFAGGFALGGVFATPLILLACVIAYRAMKGDPRDAWIRTFAIAFAATGGTTFKKANLTDAHFTEARLESTDFQEAILTRTCFKNAEELDRIRPGNTILYQPHIRELLRTGNGSEKSYVNANLQGANLDGSNLNEANLKQCNLNDASLRATNLEWANLTQVSVINTNFTNCHLTGACIEAWNIDQSTILDNVDCQYLFLLEKPGINGTRERRPHDPNKMFQTGDFEKLYREIINTVQLFLKNGINP